MDNVPTVYASANPEAPAQFSQALLASAMMPVPASISDSITLADPTFVRPSAAGTTGVPTTCPASGNPTVHYDLYEFNLSGCGGSSPVTIDTCSSAPFDTVIYVYRKGDGSASTAGSPTFFPTSPCTNVLVSNNNNSIACAAGSGLSSVTTNMTDGNFVVVVSAANANQTGNYTLSVTSPSCTVTQIQSCNATLDHNADSFTAGGGTGSVNVAIGSTCAWTAVSNDSWITVTSGASGTGNGSVGFTVDPNSGDARTGTITIAGLTFNVTQEAGAVALPCIHDALVDGNPTFVRPSVAAAGTVSCPATGNPTTRYKAYEFDLSCAGSVTASTCTNGVCPGPVTLADTIIVMYRKSDGSASSPGSPIFNPATPCANAVIGNNNNSTACGPGSSLSSVTQSLPAGRFVVVVTSAQAGELGTFKLNVTSNTPGCNVTLEEACSTVTGTVTPTDQTVCPGSSGSINVSVSGGEAPYTVSLNNGGGTQTDSGPFTFTVTPASTTTYTATGTDANGCPITMSGTATVTVEDTTDPVITCPANVTTSTDPDQCSATVNPGTATATDTCPGSVTVVGTRSDAQALNAPYPIGTTTITWTATDASGNDASCQQTVTVNDNQDPVITCPANVVAPADASSCSANVDPGTATATDNCPGVTVSGSRSDSQPLNDPYPVGTTTITWTATDAAGNDATCTQTVTVNDTTAPDITCPANITQSTDPDQCSANINPGMATATDNCSVTVNGVRSDSQPLNAPYPKGTTTITWTATDASNNTDTCTQTITVNDTQDPAISCPANITQSTDPDVCSANVNPGTATASDNCPGVTVSGTRSDSQPLNAPYPKGTTTITWTATDASGNDATCTQTITVNDTQGPTIVCPAKIVTPANPNSCYSDLDPGTATATDNCPGAVTVSGSRSDSQPLNDPYPGGTTTITWTATDSSGNTSTCTQTYTVTDASAPVIVLNNQPHTLWPPDHSYHSFTVTDFVASASDACDAGVDITDVYIVKITSDEVEDGPGDGSTLNDIVIAANCKSFQLRAERQNNGDGRVYTIFFAVKDASGNTGTATATVTVPKTQSGNGAVDSGPQYTVNSICP